MVKVTAAISLIQNKEGGGQGAGGEHGACQGSGRRKRNITFNFAGVEGEGTRGVHKHAQAHAHMLVPNRSDVEEMCSHGSVRLTHTHIRLAGSHFMPTGESDY